jgi:hypothetical protein
VRYFGGPRAWFPIPQAGREHSPDRLTHRQEPFASFTVEAGLEIVGEPDAPGRTGRNLLACDDAVVDETMNG